MDLDADRVSTWEDECRVDRGITDIVLVVFGASERQRRRSDDACGHVVATHFDAVDVDHGSIVDADVDVC